MKYFKLVHAPTWKIPQYMNCFYLYVQDIEFGTFNFFSLSATPYCFARYITLEKDDFFHEIFQVVHAPTWKIPQYMKIFLFISIYALYRPFFWKKMIFFMKYFKLVHAPTWKIPQYMNCFLFICTRHRCRYLQLFFAICDSLMLCKVHCFCKRWFFAWNISSWCMPQLERFLNIWKFFYSFVQDIQSSVSSTLMRYLRLPTALQGTLFWEKMIFHEIYFKLVHAQTWKIPFYMIGFLSICTRQESFGIFNNFPLSATLLCLVRYNCVEKDGFLMEYFKLVHAPTWKIP